MKGLYINPILGREGGAMGGDNYYTEPINLQISEFWSCKSLTGID